MPEADDLGRLPCPRCNERPITVRRPLGESETTWCVGCGIGAKTNGGDSIEMWNDMIRGSREQ